MTKFRYFLIAVVGVCTLILLLSISGLWQITGKKIDSAHHINKGNKDVQDDADYSNDLIEDKEKSGIFEEKANQMIFGLYLPSYDDSGRETSVVRSKYTALFENKIYKIKEPVIEFKNISGEKGVLGTENVLVTADEGIMDVETSVGTLTGNVVIKLDNETQINTDSLSYLPEKKSLFTDDNVAIVGEKMIIRGQKLEVNLASSKGTIKNNVEMEFNEIGGKPFDGKPFDIDKKKKASTDKYQKNDIADLIDDLEGNKTGPKSYVKGIGQLVFDMNINAITFYDDVHAAVSDMIIFSDQLRVVLESDKKKIKKVIADGDVLTMSQLNIAKGDVLIWDAETGIATIEDKTGAEFLNDTILITSKMIRLYQNKSWVEVPSAGELITKSNLNLLGGSYNAPSDIAKLDGEDYDVSNEDEIDRQMEREYYNQKYQNIRDKFLHNDSQGQNNNVNVAWKGRMLFKNDEHVAEFEEDVKVIKTGSQMNSEGLTITFNEKNEIKSIVATEKVYVDEQKKDYRTEAEADMMTWGTDNKQVELVGEPLAKIKLGNKQLSSSKILIFDNGDIVSAKDKGNLTINSTDKQIGKDKENTGYIHLEWQGNMVFNSKEGKASFYDKIEAFKDGLNIKCDVFNVFFDEKENVKKVVALENVYISSDIIPDLEGFGTMLTWDVDENIAILTGDPVAELRKEGSRTLAKKVFFDINSRQVTWEGRTQWQMVKEEEKGEE